jgi:hypothetical protein
MHLQSDTPSVCFGDASPVVAAWRFPGGESGSDVYNRVYIFEDRLIC